MICIPSAPGILFPTSHLVLQWSSAWEIRFPRPFLVSWNLLVTLTGNVCLMWIGLFWPTLYVYRHPYDGRWTREGEYFQSSRQPNDHCVHFFLLVCVCVCVCSGLMTWLMQELINTPFIWRQQVRGSGGRERERERDDDDDDDDDDDEGDNDDYHLCRKSHCSYQTNTRQRHEGKTS